MMRTAPAILYLLLFCGPTPGVVAAEPGVEIELEFAAAFQNKNEIQIPNSAPATRFSLKTLAGTGPWSAFRADWRWNINDRHGLRGVLAPFTLSETGTLPGETVFAGQSYSPQEPVGARYRFNSWRLGYRYNFANRGDWQFWVGGTLKIRDAEIELSQGENKSADDNVGLVPLLYLAADYQINPDWSFQADFDGLAGGPGRALDLSARFSYAAGERWRWAFGYRGLEGGVDADDVYNFAWINYAFFALKFRL